MISTILKLIKKNIKMNLIDVDFTELKKKNNEVFFAYFSQNQAIRRKKN